MCLKDQVECYDEQNVTSVCDIASEHASYAIIYTIYCKILTLVNLMVLNPEIFEGCPFTCKVQR